MFNICFITIYAYIQRSKINFIKIIWTPFSIAHGLIVVSISPEVYDVIHSEGFPLLGQYFPTGI
jgi:hypothetical protein